MKTCADSFPQIRQSFKYFWTTPIVAALFARGKQLDPNLNQKDFVRVGRETAESILANGSIKLYRTNFDKFLMELKLRTESQ